jgi:hypothetical protein
LPIVLVKLRVTQAPHAEREAYVFKTYHHQPWLPIACPDAEWYSYGVIDRWPTGDQIGDNRLSPAKG